MVVALKRIKIGLLAMLLIFAVLFGCRSIEDALFSKAFRMRPCTDAYTYQIIDTAAVYRLVQLSGDTNYVDARLEKHNVSELGTVMKFFKDGRVVQLRGYTNEGFFRDRKLITKGIYCINKEKSQMEFRHYHVQSSWFSEKCIIEMRGDTLYSISAHTATVGGGIDKYVKSKTLKLEQDFTPNW